MKITIRAELPSDVAGIHALTAAAFLNAPHAAHTEQYIVDALRAAGALALSLVAEIDGRLVGHVALSPVSISDGTPGWYGLGPISIEPELQGQGIGSRLMQEAMHQLQTRGAAGCVLVGDPGFYTRFGFQPQAGLMVPEVPPEYCLVLAFGAPLPQGVVSFHAAFQATA